MGMLDLKRFKGTWRQLPVLLHLAMVAALVANVASAQICPPSGPVCERASVNNRGVGGNDHSNGPTISGDGALVGYFSDASNLVTADGNNLRDVFLRDRPECLTSRISEPASGVDANGASQAESFGPALSWDGKFFAFSSAASNLVPGDVNGVGDVFLKELDGGAIISLTPNGNGTSIVGDANEDGCCVVYWSFASNLVSGDTNGVADVFLYNCRNTTTTKLISLAGTIPANRASITPAVSGDCGTVAFASAATNLVDGDTNGFNDIFVVTVDTGAIRRVSVSTSGAQANGTSFYPDLDFDGNVVAFKSDASNLVPNDTNAEPDAFVHDLQTSTTERVSVNDFEQQANGFSGPPSIDAIGRLVAFPSWASNLVTDDRNDSGDVFIRDLTLGLTHRITCGVEPNSSVPDIAPRISADGMQIAFASNASNLVPDDTNNALDVFVGPTAPTCDRDEDCNDGLFCNGVETCVSKLCTAGTPPCESEPTNCTCNEEADRCELGCVIDSMCYPAGTTNPEEACQVCDPVANPTDWTNRPDGTVCNDGEFCTVNDMCREGTCTGEDRECPPGQVCVEEIDQCTFCGNGILDPGEECDDGNVMDGDCCSPVCRIINDGEPCEDGEFCTIEDMCDGGTCEGGNPRPCPTGQVCDEVTDMCIQDLCGNGRIDTGEQCDDGNNSDTDCCAECVIVNDGEPCDDGEFCNVDETCLGGVCQGGEERECPPGQTCNEQTDMCDTGVCGNGRLDAGEECDDGNNVDGDCCSALCRIEPDGGACDDGEFCTNGETCLDGMCQGGTPRTCPTGQVCSEETDMCVAATPTRTATVTATRTHTATKTTSPTPDEFLHNDGCQLPAHGSSRAPLAALIAPIALLITRRRRATRIALLAIVSLSLATVPARAEKPSFLRDQNRPYGGATIGFSHPTNDHFNAVSDSGGSVNPYAGYMWGQFLGWQGDFHWTSFHPHGHDRDYPGENEWSNVLGITTGPRATLPMRLVSDQLEDLDLFVTAQGGFFSGISGRLGHTAAGFSIGGGTDYYLTDNIALTASARWNRAYFSPRPTKLGPPFNEGPGQVEEDQGPADARWYTVGLGVKYDFVEAASPPPPPPPPPPPTPAPTPAPVEKKIVFRVNFDFDKSNIRPDAKSILEEAVNILREQNAQVIITEGHTDWIGSDAYNLALSQRRADSVRRFLITHGIPESRISIAAFGESKPVATNETDDGRAQNRRVEIRILE